VSAEITNEGKGWHLHLHVYVDARWIDASELAKAWGRRVGQEFGIVKVKDARAKDYCAEVTKYVVKPAELVSWHPQEISQFIQAVTGVRMHATFGTLFKLSREIKREMQKDKPPSPVCKCGCDQFVYRDERAELIHEALQGK